MRRNAAVLFALFLALQLTGLAQGTTSGASGKATEFYPLEEVRTGQKGVARTVFAGAEPEEFNLEVLGVLPGFPAPRKSVIIARLSGPQVERTSVFAGMSGSPVYIDGKLVGAIAYASPFEKEPIAGIQPISNMIQVIEEGRKEEPRSSSSPLSFNTLVRQAASANFGGATGTPMAAQVGPRAAMSSPQLAPFVGHTIVPIATPVTFSGFSQATIEAFGEDLKKIGIQPI